MEGLAEYFTRHLRELWREWVRANALSFPEQVVALFSRFQDDTVSLDSKTGRLPRFDAIRTHQSTGSGIYLIAEGQGKRWCASVQEQSVDEGTIATFEAFCKTQAPRPARKVVVAKSGIDDTARLVAKAVNMWVWEPEDLQLLMALYGHF